MTLAEQLTHGVPIATPVFDGAREPDIVELLTEAGPRCVRPVAAL